MSKYQNVDSNKFLSPSFVSCNEFSGGVNPLFVSTKKFRGKRNTGTLRYKWLGHRSQVTKDLPSKVAVELSNTIFASKHKQCTYRTCFSVLKCCNTHFCLSFENDTSPALLIAGTPIKLQRVTRNRTVFLNFV